MHNSIKNNGYSFRFKQFSVNHDKCAMKVGTDGVLLGAWARLEDAQSILDIGTGSGLIALMCAQKNPDAKIDAVEIDTASCYQAIQNILVSHWASRIKVYNVRIQNFYSKIKYDLIISNPPYFKNHKSSIPNGRDFARNSNYLPANDIIKAVRRLLSPHGSFFMIFPYEEGIQFGNLAEKNGLFVNKMTTVKSYNKVKPERIMICFKSIKEPLEKDELVIHRSNTKNHQYTDGYIALTKDFYLYL